LADGACPRAGDGNAVAPGIVFILNIQRSRSIGRIENPGYIALLILAIPIGSAIVGEAINLPGRKIAGKDHRTFVVYTLRSQIAGIVIGVFCGVASERFADSLPGVVIIHRHAGAVYDHGVQPTTRPVHLAAPITQRVADGIVSDCLAVVGSQQIFPRAVCIEVCVGVLRRPQRTGGICVFFLAYYIPGTVIGIHPGLPSGEVIFPCQLVQAIVNIGNIRRAVFRDCRDIAVGIIGVIQPIRIAAVVVLNLADPGRGGVSTLDGVASFDHRAVEVAIRRRHGAGVPGCPGCPLADPAVIIIGIRLIHAVFICLRNGVIPIIQQTVGICNGCSLFSGFLCQPIGGIILIFVTDVGGAVTTGGG